MLKLSTGEKARVLSADPPWSFGDKLPGEARGAEKHYQVLELHDIMRFELPEFEKDAMLLLWRVSSQVEEAYQVVRAWGFVPKSEIVWVKQPKSVDPNCHDPSDYDEAGNLKLHMGMGHYTRGAHETYILATRGRFKVDDRSIKSVFFAPVGEHSEKPAEFYEMIEKLTGFNGAHVELFGRKARPGWHVFGNEIDTGKGLPKAMYDFTPRTAKPIVEETKKTNGAARVAAEVPCNETPAPVARPAIDGTTPRASVAVPYPPPTRGSKFVLALCAECHEPQYTSPSGTFCKNGHGGADSIPEGDPDGGVESAPAESNDLKLSDARYIAIAVAHGVLTAEEAKADDAKIRLAYKAPAGWFKKVNAYVADHLKRNHVSPENVDVPIAFGAIAPSMENLSALARQLAARGIEVSLVVLASFSPMQRDVAQAFAEQGGEAPAFLTEYRAKENAKPFDAPPAPETPAETPRAKRGGRKKKNSGQSLSDVADTIAMENGGAPKPPPAADHSVDAWELAKLACMNGDDQVVENGFWS